MNKHIFYIAAACVALASCVKNEVRVNAPDQEITFQTVVGKASSKAIITNTTYPTNVSFGTFAYFYPKSFGTNTQLYISNAEVKYNTGATSGNVWTTDPAYYWPKQGKLTFYSYSPYTIHDKVSCTETDGLKIANYDVNANQDIDIMVADRKDDHTQNGENAGYNGVPTVFRHKLAQVVKFTIATKDDYAKGTVDAPKVGDKRFFVKEIKIGNIAYKGTFKSGIEPKLENKGTWTKTNDKKDSYTWYSNTTGVEFTKANPATPSTITNGYLLVLPQEMTDKGSSEVTSVEYIQITYDIRTYWGTAEGNYSTETVTQSVDLKSVSASWEVNKKYSYNITVGLDQIYWAPSVVEWEDGTTTNITF